MLPSFLMLLLLAGPAATQAAEAQNAPRFMEGCQQRYLGGLSEINRGIANIYYVGFPHAISLLTLEPPKNLKRSHSFENCIYMCISIYIYVSSFSLSLSLSIHIYIYACMHGEGERESDTA